MKYLIQLIFEMMADAWENAMLDTSSGAIYLEFQGVRYTLKLEKSND